MIIWGDEVADRFVEKVARLREGAWPYWVGMIILYNLVLLEVVEEVNHEMSLVAGENWLVPTTF